MNFKDLDNYNLNNYNERMFGVHEGILSGQHDRLEELNSKIYSRNSHECTTKQSPIFEPRPTPTKQSIFPILNLRNTPTPLVSTFDYDKVSSNNVHVENILQQRVFALQKGAEQSVYVPASTSDLYHVSVPSTPSVQPFPSLFLEPQFESSVHPNIRSNIGNEIFGNNTRVQLRSLL
jgi:hypothetical protein